jgi:hypothetical protein
VKELIALILSAVYCDVFGFRAIISIIPFDSLVLNHYSTGRFVNAAH